MGSRILGVFHSTTNSGLHFHKFSVSNGTRNKVFHKFGKQEHFELYLNFGKVVTGISIKFYLIFLLKFYLIFLLEFLEFSVKW